ncbi:hypothetical protein [Qipengyuania sediminis]|uniref:hypothetical protein n=1 Tax=Qipengyuania sediminis TaxID=1532023 RepID=UPI0010592ABD|nr:hypothetical protein [Qipengyuania sediminis]
MRRRSALAEGLQLAGLALLLAPAGIVVHELGHFLVGWADGYPVRLNPGSVSFGPSLGDAPDRVVALQAAAGPLATVALMAIAAISLRRQHFVPWAFALAITAPLRFLVGGAFVFALAEAWLQGRAFGGRPNFDEYNAAVALSVSPAAVVGFQMVMVLVFWTWSIIRAPRGRRAGYVGATLAGAIAGIALWMGIIGPALLGP